MTIEDAEKVDGAGISKESGDVVLVISDHLPWQDEQVHFRLIEKKISRYIDFINSGQLLEALPQARGRRVRINLIHQYEPSDLAFKFLIAAKEQLRPMGIELSYQSLPKGY